MAKLAGIATVLIVAATLAYFGLNRGYGKVSSDAYKVSTALYGACMAKDETRIDAVSKLISSEAEKPLQLSNQERTWIGDIVADARSGNWKSATKASKRMLDDQVVR